MGKKRGAVRSRERDYIPFGTPDAVVIEHVEAEKLPDGTWRESRWVERVAGHTARALDSTDPTPVIEQGGLHSKCKGRPGITRLWERDGRQWCRSCYALRYGEQPPADLEVKVKRAPVQRAPMTELDKLMRRPFGRL